MWNVFHQALTRMSSRRESLKKIVGTDFENGTIPRDSTIMVRNVFGAKWGPPNAKGWCSMLEAES